MVSMVEGRGSGAHVRSCRSHIDSGQPAVAARQGGPLLSDPASLALVTAALATAGLVLALVAVTLRQRRRLRALVERIEHIEAGAHRRGEVRAGPAAPGSAAPGSAPPSITARLLGALRPSLLGRIDEAERAAAADAPGKAAAFVRANLSRSITVPQLARAASLSERSLHRALLERFGCTPKELVTAIKMRAAMRLLRSGEHAVKEVAYQVGFANPYHFSRRFKEVFGVPPSSVRPDP